MTADGERRFAGIDLVVRCSDPVRVDQPAKYKIAAWWQGGTVRDLKTFGFADDSCLERVFRTAVARAQRIPLTPDEAIGPVGIFDLAPGVPARELRQREELERRFAGPPNFDPLLDS